MSDDIKISIRNLFKIFGPDPQGALEHVRAGMGKSDLLEEQGHVLGLKDINVDMQAGKITVIMGLSGSGKSTLIRHLNRLIEPTAGEVIVNGEDVLAYNEDQLRRLRRENMSMVFQKFALLPHRTVLENAGMPLEVRGYDRKDREDEARKWLNRVGLEGQDNQFPHQLSGGMQQRVGIARALTSNADIMLMDEAFSALDPLIRTDMQDLLLELQEELHKTVVFITHDLDEALKLADHLVILKDGQIIQQGEPQHILLHPNDPYIMDFISDINRARVLRVRSVMQKTDQHRPGLAGDVDAEDTLESVIALSGGDTALGYRVLRHGTQVGILSVKDLVRALVPTAASEEGPRSSSGLSLSHGTGSR
ncbi:glycine betaine/proline transport system ATP-binding protein [Rhodovulum bhavnagarense]|uniref:Quaternary amine transport ATP-binding protein n=1 Tax=Rhodovulum bhavnagarense TaxID=992286 RepID=A0A4R2RFV0_9RHOB|nr:betaine/proline/choline family ABC transporter ATP-binding protein [Rhodovulum bhavnagarense]TCP60967.1 glycine betaine/proline transport system ATP-binding protein [Rhodovulum bhavnagarense]